MLRKAGNCTCVVKNSNDDNTWRLVAGLSLECEVEFVDNKEVLQLLDGRGGVLDVLDEEVGYWGWVNTRTW